MQKKQLDMALHKLPETVVENMIQRINTLETDAENSLIRESGRINSTNKLTSVQYFDLDRDGDDELLVQFPIGPHGNAIQIYKIKHGGMDLVAEWSTDVPCEFYIDETDTTLGPMLMYASVNTSTDLPYIAGLRDTVWMKLINGELNEVKRQAPSREDVRKAREAYEH